MKNKILRTSIFLSLTFAFGYYIMFCQYGFVAYWSMCKNISKENVKIARLQEEIIMLKKKLETADRPFEKEIQARYDFGMGYTNELVYVIPKNK
jgi:cell division protein FtsB